MTAIDTSNLTEIVLRCEDGERRIAIGVDDLTPEHLAELVSLSLAATPEYGVGVSHYAEAGPIDYSLLNRAFTSNVLMGAEGFGYGRSVKVIPPSIPRVAPE